MQIGFAIADSWGFPDNLTCGIGYHHTPFAGVNCNRQMNQVLYVANYIAQKLNIGYSDAVYAEQDTYEKCLGCLSIDQISIDLISEDLINEILKMEQHGWF